MGKKGKGMAAVAVAGLALAVAGLAYFAATGRGNGSANLVEVQSLAVSPASPAGPALYPGGSSDVSATVHNSNSFTVHVHAFALDTGEPSDGITNDAPGCTSGGNTGSSASSVTFNGPVTNGSGDFVFPPGDTTLTLPNALSMSTTAENACQGATFTVYLQASA